MNLPAMRCLIALCIIVATLALDLSGETLYKDVLSYSASGEHRTGSKGFKAALKWYATELEAAGYETELIPYHLGRYYDLAACDLKVGGGATTVLCFPVWPVETSTVTSAEIVFGCDSQCKGNVVVFNISGISLDDDTLRLVSSAVFDGGAVGVVLINAANKDLGSVLNLPVALNDDAMNTSKMPQWGVPVVVVGSSAASLLLAGAHINTLSITGSVAENQTEHVLHAWLPATVSTSKPAVILESGLSGWHVCGGERGPGVAISLSLARWYGDLGEKAAHAVHIFATSGHEIGASFGLPDFFGYLAGINLAPNNVAGWLHTGSATVTYSSFDRAGVGSGTSLARSAYTTGSLLGNCSVAPLTEAGYSPQATKPGGGGGGVAELINAGYNALGFWGSFPRFHTPDDDATSVGPDLIEPVALALHNVMQCFEGISSASGLVLAI